MNNGRQTIHIRFTKPAEPKTRFKAIQLIEMPLSKQQMEAINGIFRKLSHESSDQHHLELIRYDKNVILANTKSIDKWTIFPTGTIIKYP